ncbi:hypothetical protein NEIMUCOT_06278 [Neisseria mucosa ATCC 25996]|uniref:Uncharacterized protein n=1 Tax=Neisseria mucosa (strain ATCC 25996 / DSM 4631 / NCTC 10774 / M26) TaxID=546266 RepID=D3A043_NEIM2|nr:hypothetical protein NEIMUCOT_06278 [Neisseria mucosa ATCC 25996]SUA37487.1 Uncharacterised protein [Neisseria mucosa]
MTKVGKLRIEDKVIQLDPQNKCKDNCPTQTGGQKNLAGKAHATMLVSLKRSFVDLKKVV